MKKPRKKGQQTTYSFLDELMASPMDPMPEAKRLHQLTRMYQGLRALELDATPTTEDWRVCSDAVNLLETLILQGHMQDVDNLLPDATHAMAMAGKRHIQGQRLGLSGDGMQAIRQCLDNYAEALGALSARDIIKAHRATERRILDMRAGKKMAHDVEVISI